jgi:hypothetical protein
MAVYGCRGNSGSGGSEYCVCGAVNMDDNNPYFGSCSLDYILVETKYIKQHFNFRIG